MKPAAFVLALVLAAWGLVRAWRTSEIALGMDFYQFWGVGQALRTMPVHNIYGDVDRRGVAAELARRAGTDPMGPRYRAVARFRPVFETYSTPFLYAALSLFRSPHYELAFRHYQAFGLLCSVFAVLVFARLLRFSWTTSLFAVAVAVGFFEPLMSDVRMANVNQIQLAGLAVFTLLVVRSTRTWHDVLAGAAVVLLVLFKPNTLFVAALWAWWWLVAGRTRRLAFAAGGAVLGTALAFGASAWLFGSLGCWSDWVVALLAMPEDIIPLDSGNFALVLLLRQATGLDASGWLTAAFLLPAVVAIWRQRRAVGQEALFALYVVGLGSLVYLLGAKLVWLHYFTATIPLLLVGLRPRERGVKRSLADSFLPLAAPVMICVTPLFSITEPVVAGWFVCGGALLLYGMAVTAMAFGQSTSPAGGTH